jgi:putative MATE family efflux protein
MGTFFQQFYNTADAMIVGNFVGTSALAAVGATSAIINLLVGFFTGLASGASVVISQYFGAGARDPMKKGLHTAMLLALFGGLLISVVGIALSAFALELMNTPQDVLQDATRYMQVYYLGMVPLMVYNMGTSVLRAIGDSRRPVYILIVSAICNILLDLLLVAVLPLGVAGAALATVLSEVIAAVLVLICLLSAHGEPWQLERDALHWDMGQLRAICRVGLPAGLQSVLYTVSNMVVQASINSFGTDTVAAWTIYGKVDFIYWMTVNAMGLSITTFAGQNFGARKYDRMKKGTLVALGITALLTVLISAGMLLLARPVLRLFTSDVAVMDITLEMMYFLVPTYITYVCVEIFSGTVRGAGDAVIPTVLTCFGVCVLRVMWVLLAVPKNPTVIMVEWSYPITWSITSILFLVYYLQGGWLRRRRQFQDMQQIHDV